MTTCLLLLGLLPRRHCRQTPNSQWTPNRRWIRHPARALTMVAALIAATQLMAPPASADGPRETAGRSQPTALSAQRLNAQRLITELPMTGHPITGGTITAGTITAGTTTGRTTSYRWPVLPPTVLRPFDPGVSRYAAGHRGVDLRAGPDEPVRAAAAGTVSFAGSVAGRGVVVVAHLDGIRTTYEPVTPLVRAGGRVAGGQVIATVRGSHTGCRISCLHWGARRGDVYLDPLALVRPLGPVRLLPNGPGTPAG